MVGQHLLMRCTKGVYDNSTSPGVKTAAISEEIASLPQRVQGELNRVITSLAKMPDITATGGRTINRGILRIVHYKDVLLAMRTFRISDLCTHSGNVSFTHTYIFTGEERNDILSHPESLIHLESFDNYANVNERCGGLSSKKPVPINKNLVMPVKKLSPVSSSIFDEFSPQVFQGLINALCQRISSAGSVIMLLSDVTPSEWEISGGSEKGEKLIVALMRLLPDCITRFFSAVSFWNEDTLYDALKEIKFRIYSGKSVSGLESTDISLLNLQKNEFSSDITPNGHFAEYLFQIKNSPEAIDEFHQFITNVFGENVDKIRKLPSVMNLVTDLFYFQKGMIHSKDEIEKVLISLLKQMGTSLTLFPQMELLAEKMFTYLTNDACSKPLETIILQLMKQEGAKNICFYSKMSECLIANYFLDRAEPETSDFVVKFLYSTPEYQQWFQNWVRILHQESQNVEEFQLSESACDKLVVLLEEQSTQEVYEILRNAVSMYRLRDDVLSCQKVCSAFLHLWLKRADFSIKHSDKITIYSGCLFVVTRLQNSGLSSELENFNRELKNYINQLGSDTEIKTFFVCMIPDSDTLCKNFASLFPIFIKALPSLAKLGNSAPAGSEDYNNYNIWRKFYNHLLKSPSFQDDALHADDYFEDAPPTKKFCGIAVLESNKMESLPDYRFEWKNSEKIIESSPNQREAFSLVNALCLTEVSRNLCVNEKYLMDFCSSPYCCQFYQYLVSLNKVPNYVERIEAYLRHKVDILDEFSNIENGYYFVDKIYRSSDEMEESVVNLCNSENIYAFYDFVIRKDDTPHYIRNLERTIVVGRADFLDELCDWEDVQDPFFLAKLLCNSASSQNIPTSKYIKNICASKYIYPFFLYSIRSNASYVGVLEKNLTANPDFLEKIVNTLQEYPDYLDICKIRYYHWWCAVKDVVNNSSDRVPHSAVEKILIEEVKLPNDIRKDMMYGFCEFFMPYLNNQQIGRMELDTLQLLKKGLNEYCWCEYYCKKKGENFKFWELVDICLKILERQVVAEDVRRWIEPFAVDTRKTSNEPIQYAKPRISDYLTRVKNNFQLSEKEIQTVSYMTLLSQLMEKEQSSLCEQFLKKIGRNRDTYDATIFVMYGLEFIAKLMSELEDANDKMGRYAESFSKTFAELLRTSQAENRMENLQQSGKIYQYFKSSLDEKYRAEISSSAKLLKDKEIAELFKEPKENLPISVDSLYSTVLEKTTENPMLIVLFVLAGVIFGSVIIAIASLINETAGLIVSLIAFLLSVMVLLIVCIMPMILNQPNKFQNNPSKKEETNFEKE